MIKGHLLDIFSWIVAISLLLLNQQKEGVVVLDVGQGDSILIQKDNVQILIDGGEDDSVLYQLAKYMPYGDMEIEVVVLTHPHSDHLGGLFYIFERYAVGEVWFNDIDYESAIYQYFLELEIPRREVVEGEMYRIEDWVLEVLFASDEVYRRDSNANNASIVLQLDTNVHTFLFMGDAEVEEERYLMEKGVLQEIDILKAGHHCSKTASSDIFLDIVEPEVAICSYGKENKFGHPHIETIERFESRNIQILSTEKEGNIWAL